MIVLSYLNQFICDSQALNRDKSNLVRHCATIFTGTFSKVRGGFGIFWHATVIPIADFVRDTVIELVMMEKRRFLVLVNVPGDAVHVVGNVRIDHVALKFYI